MKPETELQVQGVTKNFAEIGGSLFRKRRSMFAVNDVSFSVPQATTFGIVGESGCGKSTLARLILGLIPSNAGHIRLGSTKVVSHRDRDWSRQRRLMQMIYQHPKASLDPRMRILDQLVEPQLIHPDMEGDERLVIELAESLGLDRQLLDRYPHEISGGQAQRIVIARALSMRPRLLVCDEPVSALDVSVAAQILNLFVDIQKDHAITYVFISHDLKVVRQISHRVAVMYLGRFVEIGTPDQVFLNPVHPYTRALASAIPDVSRKQRQRILLKGDPPNPMDTPSGCPFHPRCADAKELCRTSLPMLRNVADRYVACHRAEDLSELAT